GKHSPSPGGKSGLGDERRRRCGFSHPGGPSDLLCHSHHYYGVPAAVRLSTRREEAVFSHGVCGGLFPDWSFADGPGDYSRPCAGDVSEAWQTVSQSSTGIYFASL